MTTDRENRPVGEPGGFANSNVVGPSSIAQFTTRDALERAQNMLVLLVFNPENGRYRRRLFLSLSAAERCARRARERGHIAHVVLGSFTAVEVVR